MGLIRTLLALAVLFDHTPLGPLLVGGRNAVQLFYIISGFLMSYVLVEQKSYKSVRNFYASRYIRLYPVYLVVAVLSLIAAVAANPSFIAVYAEAPPAAIAVLVVSNVLIFFQDWVMFLGVYDGDLSPTANFATSEIPLYNGLLVPQAWTLGVELSFYLIAPFVLNSVARIVALLLASLALRTILLGVGIGYSDPWTYRFFPTELALFLSGALAHRYLLPRYLALAPEVSNVLSKAAVGVLLATFVLYPTLPFGSAGKIAFLLSTFIVLMPLTFVFQHSRQWDKWVGDLSYPLYIGHLLVARALIFVFTRLSIDSAVTYAITVVVVSLAFAAALNQFVAKPVDAYRSRLRSARIRLP